MFFKIMFIYTPIISIGICFYISKNKTKCSLLLLDVIDTVSSSYNYIYNTIENTMCTYFKESHDDLMIYSVQTSTTNESIVVQKVSYYYTNILYTIVYDDDNSPNVPLYKGNVLKINIDDNKKNIIMCEWMNIQTNKNTIVTDNLLHIIKQYGGPNNDFYNYKEQPLYLVMNNIKDIIDNNIITNIDNYVIQITFDNMDMINKKIKIII